VGERGQNKLLDRGKKRKKLIGVKVKIENPQ
jgi:hypothetical protein